MNIHKAVGGRVNRRRRVHVTWAAKW